MGKTFFKGFLMGVCDTIPGISGGTIAFITGIYHRLVESVKNFSSRNFYNFVKYKFQGKKSKVKSSYKKLDFLFLITVLFGVLLGILISSRIVKGLLENQYIFVLSLFTGLIFASCFVIFREIKNHKLKNSVFLLVGIFLGVLVTLASPVSVTSPSHYYLFLGGFLGASAMFLPGISGAFIIFVMGIYEFILDALNDISGNIYPLAIFSLGILMGIIVISRVVSYLFRKDKCKTLYLLLGLVVGSLFLPVGEIFGNVSSDEVLVFPILTLLFLTGIFIILILQLFEKKSKEKLIEVSE